MLNFHVLDDGMIEARFDKGVLWIWEDPSSYSTVAEHGKFYVSGYIDGEVIENVLTKDIYEALDKANEIYNKV